MGGAYLGPSFGPDAIEDYLEAVGAKYEQLDRDTLMTKVAEILAALARVPEDASLLERLARRELYALGRNYLAGSLMIEMSPLWLLTPTLLANVDDPSALLQLVTQYSLSDNMTFLGSINVPIGYDGSEFGGIDGCRHFCAARLVFLMRVGRFVLDSVQQIRKRRFAVRAENRIRSDQV